MGILTSRGNVGGRRRNPGSRKDEPREEEVSTTSNIVESIPSTTKRREKWRQEQRTDWKF